ncbi:MULTISPECIES: aromatic-ring-hydroxylating dioxygenase subunit beta [Burkholderia]|uniref:Phenylpropionate dioxygenase n=1 Tax=Burkholderia cenocepacia TaxID=95486 RepID=A0A071MLB5_9BURK|nr:MULTISPECIES: aromatic-ring-hydroxylating dioxygenase subunit beta [Burkholderia]AOJ28182.1 phenylpropionate dioxygenase [Burkholderia seminalis]KVF47495.1 phenylpropionate dioxygenase [Burkholderia seminalis]MBJ9592732.1 aromatic-ring-hydroxylating dioxygenase subunit beta [Burkholderia seminalis]MBN3740043.1 aromatic-ring-hydroxylating dioxygenase subunit beta [Burkholderia sp. Tr-20355]MCA8040079.1 aromatic-ring-hydroxylating dioxygenase subunit beta [Burkholderia seminalis]
MRTFAHDELAAFVYREARLLDERRYEDWLALYADDARYWMPLSPDQPDSVLHGALMDEDRLLLRIRIERLAGRRTFSQQPASRGHHLLQQPYVERADPARGVYVLRTPFHYVEARRDEQTLFAGWYTHELAVSGDALRIRVKRVDLVNADAPLGSIHLPV